VSRAEILLRRKRLREQYRARYEARLKEEAMKAKTKAEEFSVATATATLQKLVEHQQAHAERAVELEGQRKQLSFGAHAQHNPQARAALDDVVDQSVRHETQGRAIADAIEEAKRRLVLAQAYEADIADQAKARQALKLVARFRQAGMILDGACQALGQKGHELTNLVSELHAAGIHSPSLAQIDVLGSAALQSAVLSSPWGKRFRVQAPSDRKNFRTLCDDWATMIESRIKAQLGEQKKGCSLNGVPPHQPQD
jgi:hypothetical protein